MQRPVSAPDDRVYEQSAIEEWVQRHGCSPFTSQPLTLDDLRPIEGFGEALQMLQQLSYDRDTLVHRLSTIKSLVNSPMHSAQDAR
jgi:hypothetical protein